MTKSHKNIGKMSDYDIETIVRFILLYPEDIPKEVFVEVVEYQKDRIEHLEKFIESMEKSHL